MRYRIEKVTEDEIDMLKAWVYPKPFCFDATPDEKKSFKLFEFSEDGLLNVTGWLNEQLELF